MIEKVRGRSKSTGQTAGMIENSQGRLRIDGPNSGNDRESQGKVKIDGPNSENDRKSQGKVKIDGPNSENDRGQLVIQAWKYGLQTKGRNGKFSIFVFFAIFRPKFRPQVILLHFFLFLSLSFTRFYRNIPIFDLFGIFGLVDFECFWGFFGSRGL